MEIFSDLSEENNNACRDAARYYEKASKCAKLLRSVWMPCKCLFSCSPSSIEGLCIIIFSAFIKHTDNNNNNSYSLGSALFKNKDTRQHAVSVFGLLKTYMMNSSSTTKQKITAELMNLSREV